MQKAQRNNEGKLQWHLLPFEQLEPVVKVLMAGAKKYAPFNWQKPMSREVMLDSAQRHMAQLWKGEELDSETGQPHAAHVICNMLFYLYHNGGESKNTVSLSEHNGLMQHEETNKLHDSCF